MLLAAVVLILAGCASPADDPSAGAPAGGDSSATSTSPSNGDAGSADGSEEGTFTVLDVIDGDTLEVQAPGGPVERVRLVGINAPERGECFDLEATDALAELVGDGPVVLEADESDRDRYDRLLRYVEVDGSLVNEQLVRGGFARSQAFPPDTGRQDQLDRAEDEARSAGAGLWGASACGEPSAAGRDGDVVLVAAVADPPGPDEDDPNAETVTVANQGERPADLSGWVLKDTSASHRYAFPDGFVLAPGAEVVVRTGCGSDTGTDLHWCNRGSMVWNNSGDTAYLEDPAGNTVSTLEV